MRNPINDAALASQLNLRPRDRSMLHEWAPPRSVPLSSLMSRRKRSKRGWPKLLFVAVLVYTATFLVWSRARTFKLSAEQGRAWSFFAPPGGLAVVNPARWKQWKRRERIAATIFWPCVLLDEKLTKRIYWPAQFADPPRII